MCITGLARALSPLGLHSEALIFYREVRVDPSIAESLLRMGHQLRMWPEWAKAAGSLGTIRVDHEHGVLLGAADPRRLAYTIGR